MCPWSGHGSEIRSFSLLSHVPQFSQLSYVLSQFSSYEGIPVSFRGIFRRLGVYQGASAQRR